MEPDVKKQAREHVARLCDWYTQHTDRVVKGAWCDTDVTEQEWQEKVYEKQDFVVAPSYGLQKRPSQALSYRDVSYFCFPIETQLKANVPLNFQWSLFWSYYKYWSIWSRYLALRQERTVVAPRTQEEKTPLTCTEIRILPAYNYAHIVVFNTMIWISWPPGYKVCSRDCSGLLEPLAEEFRDRALYILCESCTSKIQQWSVAEVVPYQLLQYFLFDHVLVPSYRLFPASEQHYQLSEAVKDSVSLLPRMLIEDPVAKAFHAQVGDIFEIQPRKRPHCVYYRRVIGDYAMELERTDDYKKMIEEHKALESEDEEAEENVATVAPEEDDEEDEEDENDKEEEEEHGGDDDDDDNDNDDDDEEEDDDEDNIDDEDDEDDDEDDNIDDDDDDDDDEDENRQSGDSGTSF